jgi:hypothetical protein
MVAPQKSQRRDADPGTAQADSSALSGLAVISPATTVPMTRTAAEP